MHFERDHNKTKTHQPQLTRRGETSEAIATATGVIPRLQNRPGIGANDGPVDDFIALTESWRDDEGNGLQPPQPVTSSHSMLDLIAQQFSAGQMRQLGCSLLKLADALDDGWDPDKVRSSYHWVSRVGRIERQALQLAQVAIRLRTVARRRVRHLAADWFGEPAWEMLLELFIQFAGGARVSTKSLAIASGASDTTALRVIDRLVESGLAERSTSQMDKRVTLVSLTRKGVVAVGSILLESES